MQKSQKLNNGFTIPVLGLGTWRLDKNRAGDVVRFAINKALYRHIDCASIYGNEKEIGEAFKDVLVNSVKREDLFITGKLWNTDHFPEDVEKACKKTLSDLQVDYLDLYLIHWGVAFRKGGDLEPLDENGKVITENIPIHETWQAMEKLVKKGLVKSIGVANFTTTMLIDLLTYASINPVINQIELHPYNTQTDLIEFCRYKGIAVTAYSPLGHGAEKLLGEPIINKIAAKYKKTPAQVLLSFAIGRKTIAIPKSTKPERISENMDVFDFELTKEEIKEITSLNKNHKFVNPVKWWGIPYFA